MIYFDNAATTFPKPEKVIKRVIDCIESEGGNPGRSGHILSLKASEVVYEARCKIADHFGGIPERVVFTKNASEALNLCIKSFAAENSHVLISGIEHNSVLRPVNALSKKGVTYDVYRASCDPDTVLRSIREKIKPETKLIVACMTSNVFPLTLPVRAIGAFAKERGIDFVIDASQSAGNARIQLERTGASAICAPGHKSLYGIQGSGFAIFSKRVSDDRIIPLCEGGSGNESANPNMPSNLPERAEAGTLSLPAIAGLSAGMDFINEVGIEEIAYRESRLIKRALSALFNMKNVNVYLPCGYSGGNILSFGIRSKDSEETAFYLDKEGICTRGGLHCAPLAHAMLGTKEKGAVRISVGAFNTVSEIDKFVDTVRLISSF